MSHRLLPAVVEPAPPDFDETKRHWRLALFNPDGSSFVEAGAQGPPGEDGADGADGADGVPGDDGRSAYEVAVDEGFVGDVNDWLASLVGAQGPPGEDGANGAPGADGESAVLVPTFLDTFDAALSGYTDVYAGSLANYSVADGKLQYNVAAAANQDPIIRRNIDGPKNVRMAAVIECATNWQFGFLLRYVDANNYVRVFFYHNAGGSRVYTSKRIAGVTTNNGGAVITTLPTTGNVLAICTMVATTIKVDIWTTARPPSPPDITTNNTFANDGAVNGAGPFAMGYDLFESVAGGVPDGKVLWVGWDDIDTALSLLGWA